MLRCRYAVVVDEINAATTTPDTPPRRRFFAAFMMPVVAAPTVVAALPYFSPPAYSLFFAAMPHAIAISFIYIEMMLRYHVYQRRSARARDMSLRLFYHDG